MRTSIYLLGVIFLSACSWVEPTAEGKAVMIVALTHIQNCQHLGQSQSITKNTVGPLQRDAETVEKELITLARNQAAKMGGDSIVMKSAPKEGQASFEVYRCQKN